MSWPKDWLAEQVATPAMCWRVERTDGVAIGLTAHDRDLVIDGLVHRATPGMTPSAVTRSAGLDGGTSDVAGALSGEGVDERDLVAGRWDGARVRLFVVDWTDSQEASARRVDLAEGTIGAVDVADGGFVAEVAGPMLDRAVAEETSPGCRAALGDRRCRVAMAGRRRFAQVVAAAGAMVTVDAEEPVADAYGGGRLRWFDGANGGLEGMVMGSDGATVTLEAPPAFAVETGALVELVEGCDKTLATCAERFGNAENFRGEPHLPGMDLVTRWIGG